MQRKKQVRRRTPKEWISDTIREVFTPIADEDSDSDSESEDEPVASDPEEPWGEPPDQQPEIGLKITREELRKGYKL